jgi:branched-chain amino acid transport system substrate-binding protein
VLSGLGRLACSTLAGLVVATGCRSGHEGVAIGHVTSLTGASAAAGRSAESGVQLALEELNAEGGVLGTSIRVPTGDDRSTMDGAAGALLDLVKGQGVAALVGTMPADGNLFVAPIVVDNRVPLVSAASTSPRLTAAGEWVFRACYVDGMQAAAMAVFATQSLRLARLAILTATGNEASNTLSSIFRQTATRLGGTIVAEEAYEEGELDWKAQLHAFAAASAQAVYVPGRDVDVMFFAQQARELGVRITVLGGDTWGGSEIAQLGGGEAGAVYFTTQWSADEPTPEARRFVARYRARYGGATPDAMAALGYDAMKMMATAIVRAGSTDGEKIRDALAQTRDFSGVTGPITIDAQRDARKPVVVVRVEDGRLRFVERILPPWRDG